MSNLSRAIPGFTNFDWAKRGPVIAWAVFGLGLVMFIANAVLTIGPRGLWADELATLYFAAPDAPPATLIADTHPPVYYMLVRLALMAGFKGASALIAVNLVTITAFGSLAAWLLVRGGRPLLAIIGAGVVLASPAVLTFALEGRNYITAQIACAALTAAALLSLDDRKGLKLWQIGLLAAICAASHLYGALYAGALGAGFVIVSLPQKRRDNIIRGLVIGGAASLVMLVWAIIAAPVMFGGSSLVHWIPNTLSYTVGQLWFFAKMLVGPLPNVALLAAAVAIFATQKQARPVIGLMVLTGFIFVALPLLVSIKMPMLAGRYLTVAVPGLILMVLASAWAAVQSGGLRGLTPIGAGLTAVFFAVAAAGAPGVSARMLTEMRYPFDFTAARAALAGCTDARVRVLTPASQPVGAVDPAVLQHASYAIGLDRPGVKLDDSINPVADVSDYPCSLVGWGEHVITFDPRQASVETALSQLGLTNTGDVALTLTQVREHGFLLLRK
jgi:hypothetical protein